MFRFAWHSVTLIYAFIKLFLNDNRRAPPLHPGPSLALRSRPSTNPSTPILFLPSSRNFDVRGAGAFRIR